MCECFYCDFEAGSFYPNNFFFLLRLLADKTPNINSSIMHMGEDFTLLIAGALLDTLNLKGSTACIFEICYFITARNSFIDNIVLCFY